MIESSRSNLMGERIRIRIIETPPGQAPEWVRNEWVGLEMPVAEGIPEEGWVQLGARLGKPENLGGYPVNTADALNKLTKKSPPAASWWLRHISPELNPWLVFKREVCELLPEDSTDKS